MKEHRSFWDRNAAIYDRFMHKDSGAYAQMYDLLRPVVRHRTVLELATGTGLIAKHIVSAAERIVPHPEEALREIRRVLKDDGVLAAPTFTHAENDLFGAIRSFFMRLAGFPLHSRWSSGAYLTFLRENGWTVRKSTVLKASFPLTYAECVKTEGVE